MRPRVSLFGKLPSTLDYVRIDHESSAAIELDSWLQSAAQPLASAGASWPATALRFSFVAKDARSALVGLLAPSRDRAGRKFPVAIFRELDLRALTYPYAGLPLAAASFLDAAEAALEALCAASKEEARALLAELAARPVELGDARGALADASDPAALPALAGELLRDEVFGEAHRELRAWLARVASDPKARGLTLELPIARLSHVATWLRFVALEGDQQAPTVFWSLADVSRLTLSFGPPSPHLPLWLAEPTRRSEKLFAPFSGLARDAQCCVVRGERGSPQWVSAMDAVREGATLTVPRRGS